MAYARFDDRYDDHRKIKRALRRDPAAVALHSMAITYCCRHETDGVIEVEQVEDWLALMPHKPSQRVALVQLLLDLELFDRIDDEHFQVHDFLDWNDSKAHRTELREAGRAGARARWKRRSANGPSDAEANADRMATPNADRTADRIGGANATPNGPPHHTTPTPTPIPPEPPAGAIAGDELAAAKRARARADEQAVFDAWIAATRRTPQTLFDAARRKSIRKGLDIAGLDACLSAVRGVARSRHHMSQPQYSELRVVLRDAGQIENLGALDRGPQQIDPAALHAAYRSAGGQS